MIPSPRRPSGLSAQARWCQWVHDSLQSFMQIRSVRGAKVSSTTGGVFIEPIDTGGGSDSRVRQYILTDASNGDYFICRTLGTRIDATDPENPLTLRAIGGTDIFIAKPFALRQTPFDREAINAGVPENIGTSDEITYDVQVQSWNGVALSETTLKASYEYPSATFRIDTNATDADPGNWTTQNQTIIPRFVPAVLIEEEGEPLITETIAPTTIYAISCSNLNITTSEADGEVAVNLLALSDGFAWAKTS